MRVPWKWIRDRSEVRVVGISRWVERRLEIERAWNIVNYILWELDYIKLRKADANT